MNYIEAVFYTEPSSEFIHDILSALLADIGFESFIEDNNRLKAYVQKSKFDESELKSILNTFPVPDTTINYELKTVEDKNWNEEWEKNYFQPIVIGDKCVIHSTFHKNFEAREYDIIINPQMAFGTGHHETTSLIITELLEVDLTGKSVLDMGCGTSVLAILASLRGADPVLAIDIDSWCIENSKDNIKLNDVNNITVELGDASLLEDKGPFDVVIANINRNILLNDMKYYVRCMNQGSEIYMSGFYREDISYLQEEANRLGLEFLYSKEKNNWAVVKFIKKPF